MINRDFRWVFFLVLLVCFAQFPRGYDIQNYLRDAYQSAQAHFVQIPYPTHAVDQGAYFQSPIITVLFLPLSLLPILGEKLVWALVNAFLAILLFRFWVKKPVDYKVAFFLLLFFTYPLSDVFLSGNMNFSLLFCLCLGNDGLDQKKIYRRILGALLISLGVFIKPLALIFYVWFSITKQFRKLGTCLTALTAWVALTAIPLKSYFGAWWIGWWKALPFYPYAADPGRISFQSPPAAFYRILLAHPSFTFASRLKAANFLGLALVGAIFLIAFFYQYHSKPDANRRCLALLLAGIFLGTPFSWACTILFLFPLAYLYSEGMTLPPFAWAIAWSFALCQKAILPGRWWALASEHSFPAIFLFSLFVLTSVALFTERRKRAG